MSPHNILPIVLAIPIIEINNVALVSSIFWFEASPRKKSRQSRRLVPILSLQVH